MEAVRAGEVFQIQVGQRFSVATTADPLDVYRVLRTLNPSPYMYFLRTDEVDIVGSSPEALVTVTAGTAVLHPIAGTRRRGETPERDAALAAELVADPKERAEHVMLVDLARNDLGRVSASGSVEVVEFGVLERYSHVWHIVSTVQSQVADGMDAFDVLTATFPAGTLTGAPKVRAMELIDELEPVRRGVYGGAVGYLDAAGDLDMAIAIRTAVIRDGVAHVQASAGVVADSVPALEEQETENKARAVLQALATAETLRPVAPETLRPVASCALRRRHCARERRRRCARWRRDCARWRRRHCARGAPVNDRAAFGAVLGAELIGAAAVLGISTRSWQAVSGGPPATVPAAGRAVERARRGAGRHRLGPGRAGRGRGGAGDAGLGAPRRRSVRGAWPGPVRW